MFTYRISVFLIVFGLLLVSLVEARPVRHRRRSTCRSRPNSVPPSATIAVASTPSAVKITDSDVPVKPDVPKATPTTQSTKSTPPAKSDDDNDDKEDDDSAPSSSKEPSSTSASRPAATSANSSPPKELSNNGLFPVNGFSKSWTTNPSSSNALSLSDSTLKPTRLISALSHDFVSAPDGKKAMRAVFPKGSYRFKDPMGGISFYGLGPDNFGLENAKEVTFGYRVFFDKGFAWNKGGKLPGVYGGNSNDEAIGCSGGRRSGACFSARLMWRPEGEGEFYTYLPPFTESKFSANRKQCNVAPQSDCNPTYGASIGRGSFNFKDGQWNTVAERVKLNDVGQANGEIELFVEGKSVVSVKGLILRDSSAGRFRGIQMQTFFGGSDSSWASPKTQNIYFSDFSTAILETL